jgi:hypothetical protein
VEDDRAKIWLAVNSMSCCQPPTGSHVEGAEVEVEVEDGLELVLLRLLTVSGSMLLIPKTLSTVKTAGCLEEIESPVPDAGYAAAATGSDGNARSEVGSSGAGKIPLGRMLQNCAVRGIGSRW